MRISALVRPAAIALPRRPILARLWHALAVSRERRALASLDDHLLRDIGLTRDAAESEARRKAWDVPLHWRD